MKKVLVAILLGITFFFATYSLKAKSGYTIHVTIRNAKDSMLQLCHYNGRPGMVNIDTSIKIKPGARSECTLKSDKHLVGGLYVLLFKNKRSQMELLLNDGDEIWVEYDFDQPVESATVRGTGECADYLEYLHFLGPYNQKFKQAEEEKRKAKTHADSLLVKEKTKQLNKEMDNYRDAYAKKHPESFMAKLFKASAYKEIPDAIKGKQEKEQQFIREHIWDDFDFNDERLAHTPFTENKLANYLSVIPQQADSINAASDELLSRMKNARALYNQTVDWMVRSQENVKASFGDDCFIYIVEKYYLNGKADWISDSIRNSYQKKIALLSRNVIGSKASDFNVMNDKDQPVSLNSLLPDHAYTLLIFWSPSCNHCVDEVPKLDSAVASLGKDIQVVGVDAHGEGAEWKKWINSHTFKARWVHLYDPARKASYVSDYSVYTTPVIYLIDRKGVIVGKRLLHTNLKESIDLLESKHKK